MYGLHAQGAAEGFEAHEPAIAEMMRSFSLERWALYTEERNDDFRYSLRVPPTWKSTRTFSGGGTFLKQFTSPALGMDKGGQTAHASLTITVETVPAGSTVDAFHKATQAKLGENFQLLSHTAVEGRLRRPAAHGDPDGGVARQALLPRGGRAGLHPGLRGPRRRLPAGVALVRHDRGLLQGGRRGGARSEDGAHAHRRRAGPDHPGPRFRGDGRRPRGAARQPARPQRRRRALRGPHRPGTSVPDPRRGVLLPVLRAARGAARPLPRPGVGRGRVLRRAATASSACSTRPPTAARSTRASTSRRRSSGSRRAAGLRRFRRALFPLPDFDAAADAEPGGVVPAGVPVRDAGLAGLRSRLHEPEDRARFTARGAAARAEEAARPLLPHQLPLRRDHQRLQLQVHLVPGRHHGPPPRLHEEGEGLPHPRRDRGQAPVAGAAVPGEAAPDGRAHAPPRAARHRRVRGEPRASPSSSTPTAASSPPRTSTRCTAPGSPT